MSPSVRWTLRCAKSCAAGWRQLHEELKFTSVFVTHDQEEAMEVADRVVVMSQGNIEQGRCTGTGLGVNRPPALYWSLWARLTA
ncbi:Sulfate/thiosulfate import ATP-binding protein CysA [Raoultella planticola]|uniref:Sulfate/thiosulfate import ATP-binding protein CysA n=1 Tax=Raoultella planticola TaxID=575 RepID=A0A485C4D3_RAOPL|nr:Sulfate/thiosulfate import ATP-binding protein CysA [Raoultella planticola]